MKAIMQSGYGSPDVLELREVERPAIKENEVLVRVHAAGIHAGDIFILRGEPYPVRFMAGFPKPKNYIPGFDVAGVVEKTGAAVTRFRPGDAVFGGCQGGCAEYVSVREEHLAPKPSNVSYAEAGCVATSGLAALHGLRDAGSVQPGMHVLINGASGGVGTFAVQIAKAMGAEVTGVCSGRNAEMVRSLGADHVVDYTQTDFTQGLPQYDLILDNVANRKFSDVKRVLAADGQTIPNSGHAGLGYLTQAFVRSLYDRQQARPYLSSPKQADIEYLSELMSAGKLRSVIDRTYPLEQTPEAMAYLGKGHAAGKVVIVVQADGVS